MVAAKKPNPGVLRLVQVAAVESTATESQSEKVAVEPLLTTGNVVNLLVAAAALAVMIWLACLGGRRVGR